MAKKTTTEARKQFSVLLNKEELDIAAEISEHYGLGGVGPTLRYCMRKVFENKVNRGKKTNSKKSRR